MIKRPLSLLEIAVLMTVIALAISGFLISRSITSSSRVQIVHHELQEYLAAFSTFRLRHHALPGDFARAKTAFGSESLSGNGNGRIEGKEQLVAWLHLWQDKLFDGNPAYSRDNPKSRIFDSMNPGHDTPVSQEQNGGYRVRYQKNAVYAQTGNAVLLGWEDGQYWLEKGLLTVSLARKIDEKADDGLPASGLLYGIDGNNGKESTPESRRCAAPNATHKTQRSLRYFTETSGTPCRLLMWID